MCSCIEPYFPEEISEHEPILIVDGFVNVSGKSRITLSRTQPLTNNSEPFYEKNATIWVEDREGNKSFFTGDNSGAYDLEQQNLPNSEYRLGIITTNSNEYLSDFVPIIHTTSVDSVTWKLGEGQNVEIMVSTHDQNAPAGFYKWTFEETWEYRSSLNSLYVYNIATRNLENRNENIFYCWRSAVSTNISIESTIRFDQNRVSEFPITSFSQNSERLRLRYSILVQQQSLSRDAFSYWRQVKQSNQDLGTIFGPLPAEIRGNIKNLTNPKEPVIGFFSIGSTTYKRIFISNADVPTPQFWDTPYMGCKYDTLFLNRVSTFQGAPFLIGGRLYEGDVLVGYSYALDSCVDCRLSGGVNIRPNFW